MADLDLEDDAEKSTIKPFNFDYDEVILVCIFIVLNRFTFLGYGYFKSW